MSGLRLARAEVLWHFRHLKAVPMKKEVKPEERMDAMISELIYLADQLSQLIVMYKPSKSGSWGSLL